MSTIRDQYDVIVVGAGPAGSATALLLAQQGRSVLLLEKDRFPRYHVGESLTGTAGDFIARQGLVEKMAEFDFPSKPGVEVIGRDAKNEFFVPVLRPTWQVRRAEFDNLLLERAIAAGADYHLAAAKQVIRAGERVVGLTLETNEGQTHSPRCSIMVDASGQSVFLSRQEVAGPRRVAAFNRQIAMYTQFEGVAPDLGERRGATVIFYRDTYHWAWLIPVSSSVVSIGVVLPVSTYKKRGNSVESAYAWGLEHLNPQLTARTANAKRVEDLHVTRNYSYRVSPFVGPGWLCVGDSHCFTDPIFSFGVSFSLTEAERAAEVIAEILDTPAVEQERLQGYAHYCQTGQERGSDLIRYFWKFPAFFAFMTRNQFAEDFTKLLAGDVFTEEPLGASVEMKFSLENSPVVDQVPEGLGREIARRIYQRFDFFQGVDAAFIELSDGGVKIFLILTEDDIDLYDSLYDFEEQLVADFDRDSLAVLSFTPDLLDAMPPLDNAYRIFDRRQERRQLA